MNRTVSLAAAVAAALGSGTAFAAVPTLAEIEAVPASNTVYIAGSSAAKNAVLGDIETNVCGGAGNYYLFSSTGNSNFFAISCTPAAAVGATNSGVYNIFYRDEGGSVSGMLPIVNAVKINQFALTSATIGGCGATPCGIAVSGASTGNGIDDSFGPAGTVAKEIVDLGLSDVEPGALTGNNYPTPYSTTVWGPNNQAGLVNLQGTQLFGEVYALFVNENSAAFTENPLLLSQQMVQNILLHKVSARNWSQITDVNGAKVTNAPLAILIVNREKGSGSRAATDYLIAGDGCGLPGGGTIFDPAGATDYFSTGDVLTAAASIPGSITYATIDQSKANMVQVSLNGITPTNVAAVTGQYPFWVEATFVVNPASTADAAVVNYLTSVMQTLATAPHLADNFAIPGVPAGAGNVAHSILANSASTVAALGPATIYTNPFTRAGVTCNTPSFVATTQ